MEHLARYIIRASFSQERMTYLSEESKVTYCSKDGKQEKVFDALEWLAAMDYGYCSNVSRGKRGKLNLDEAIPCILMSEEGAKKYRKNWARLIRKIYEADPLSCPPNVKEG